ncbi:MAG: hypothetical protein ACRDID_00920, partial [Ktedonobacterales bacterium]
DQKPLPLPLPAGGLNEALNSAWKAQALQLQLHPPAAPFVKRQLLPDPVETPADLADWRQGDSRYGALRNTFGAAAESAPPPADSAGVSTATASASDGAAEAQ